MSKYINEAFSQYRKLTEAEEFTIDPMGLDNLNSFISQAMDDEDVDVDIIDLEAEAEDELKKSYIGKVICDCNVCHSNIFYNKEDITVDDEGIVNIEDECPYCLSNDGYTIVGEIKPYEENAVEIETPEENIEIESDEPELDIEVEDSDADEPIEVEDGSEEDEKIEESLITEDSLDDSGIYNASSEDLANKMPDTKFSVKTGGESKVVVGKDLPDYFPNATLKVSSVPGEQDIILDVTYDMDEGLQLSGEKELKGTSDLRHRDEHEGDEAIRGKNNTELSGDLDLHESVDLELNEDINNINIDSDDESIIISNKEDGGVVVETSPALDSESIEDISIEDEPISSEDEVIAPLDDETESDILENPSQEDDFEEPVDEFSEEESIDESEPTDEEDVDIDEFDEDSFNELGESYLRRCYENVSGFKTTKVTCNENLLTVYGNISFKSGNTKETNFIFEAKESNNGNYLFEGYNEQINIGGTPFKLNCSLTNKKLISESMSYKYKAKNELNESVNISGKVKRVK